jgi:hypothetical protein
MIIHGRIALSFQVVRALVYHTWIHRALTDLWLRNVVRAHAGFRLALPAAAQRNTDHMVDDAAIAKLTADYQAAYSRHDGKAAAALYATADTSVEAAAQFIGTIHSIGPSGGSPSECATSRQRSRP